MKPFLCHPACVDLCLCVCMYGLQPRRRDNRGGMKMKLSAGGEGKPAFVGPQLYSSHHMVYEVRVYLDGRDP